MNQNKIIALILSMLAGGALASSPDYLFEENFDSLAPGDSFTSGQIGSWDAGFSTGGGSNTISVNDPVSAPNCLVLTAPSYANRDSVSLRKFTKLRLDGKVVFTASVKLQSEVGENGTGSGTFMFGDQDGKTGVQVIFNRDGNVCVVDRKKDLVVVGTYTTGAWYTVRVTAHVDPSNGDNSTFGISIPELGIDQEGFLTTGDCTGIGGFLEVGCHGMSEGGMHGGNADHVEFSVDNILILQTEEEKRK